MLRNLAHALLNRTDCSFRSSRVPLYQIINYLNEPTPLTLKNGGQKFEVPGHVWCTVRWDRRAGICCRSLLPRPDLTEQTAVFVQVGSHYTE